VLQNYLGDIAAIAIFVVAVAASEIGYLLGKRLRGQVGNADAFKTIQSAMFPILGLLLAFTFSLALSRYDARRDAVVHEANAILTVAARADVLDPSDARTLRSYLPDYTQVRIAFVEAGSDQHGQDLLTSSSLGWQRRMWAIATRAARSDARPQLISLLLQSLNDLMDASALEAAAADAHVPTAILVILLAIAALTVGVAGFNAGSQGGRSMAFVIFALVLALVTTAIIDLDRSQTGWTRVSLTPLKDVFWSIEIANRPFGDLHVWREVK
jgi:hypothetical protein